MSDLDDRRTYERLDPSGMHSLIARLPEQAREAWRAGLDWPMPADFRRPSRVVVAGVGGSAIGADVVAALAAQTSAIPVQVQRGYSVPVMDETSLLVACSFSGDTEETLAAFSGTLPGPGMHLAISTGGVLGRMARKQNLALFTYEWDGPPRTAFAFGLFPLLAILHRLDMVPLEQGEVDRAIDAMEASAAAWGCETPQHSNLAKQIASRLVGRVPVVFGAGFLDSAARRWATEINENTKQWAFHAALPEVDHNLVLGFGRPPDLLDHIRVLQLDAPAVHERNRLRVRLTGDLLDQAGVPHEQVEAGGDTPVDAILRACYLGDWVSLYLALLNEVDPMQMEPIEVMKARLARLD